MSWFKNMLKNIAKNWLRRNKQELVYVFDDFTNEVTTEAEKRIIAKYPHMSVEMKAIMKEVFLAIDDEIDKKFEIFIDDLINKLGEGENKNVSSSNKISE